MRHDHTSTLRRLLTACTSAGECAALLRSVYVEPSVLDEAAEDVSQTVLAQALNLLLFAELLTRVPTATEYVQGCLAARRQIVFDHGALRTVRLGGMGNLPAGEAAITRLLLPLGYRNSSVYPLDRLGMTGRSYTHRDLPESLPQFFVSELHPERFSPAFQAAVMRVTGSSRDPLTPHAKRALDELSIHGRLPFASAAALLPTLLNCFQRQHAAASFSDYQLLLSESAEMAWIATEGNAFNHATDRVQSLDDLVAEQRRLGRPLKETIEISRSGRVRQTAFRADPVDREFVDANGTTRLHRVPGSFFELIQREQLSDPITGQSRLDLAFDSGNAQEIFKMTAAVR